MPVTNIINTIEELKPHVRVVSSVTKLPDIGTAETEYLLPIIGQDLYDAIIAGLNAPSVPEAVADIVPYCRRVIAPGSYIKELPLMQGQMTDAGVTVFENDNARKAFKWEYNNALEALYAQVYQAQEMLILFLKARKADYPEWASSPYNDAAGFQIIRDGSELKGLIYLMQPHRSYMSLKPILSGIAETTLMEMMGEEQYAAFNAAIVADSLTEKEKWVVNKLRHACAHLAMARAAVMLNIRFGTGGFTVADKYAKEGVDEARAAADTTKEKNFQEQMENISGALFKQAREYMDKHASESEFAPYFASVHYTDPEAVSRPIDNSGFKGSFGI